MDINNIPEPTPEEMQRIESLREFGNQPFVPHQEMSPLAKELFAIANVFNQ